MSFLFDSLRTSLQKYIKLNNFLSNQQISNQQISNQNELLTRKT